MRAAFSDISENARATLRVGISRLRAEVFFPLIWRFYHPHHENISIELIDGNSASMIEQLALGELDLYIGVDIPRNVNQKMGSICERYPVFPSLPCGRAIACELLWTVRFPAI